MKLLKRVISASVLCMVTTMVSADTAPAFTVRIQNPYQATPQFTDFIQQLQGLIEKRDAKAVYALVADSFYYHRDFGGIFNPNLSAIDNFKASYVLDNQSLNEGSKDYGWYHLSEHVSAQKFQRMGKGDICGPAEAVPTSEPKNEDYYFKWVYIDGAKVRVRAEPSTEAAIVDKLSYVPVNLLSYVMGENLERSQALRLYVEGKYVSEPNRYWAHIDLLNGKKGYVHSSFIGTFLNAKLCYTQQQGVWKIAGVIGGGD